MDPVPALVVDEGMGERRITVPGLVAHPALVTDVADRLPGRSGPAVPVAAVFTTDLPFATVASTDGEYTASIPTPDLASGGLLLLEDAGGPLRLVVAQGSTLCWNVKHVGSIRATATRQPDSVPENPPH